MARNLDLSALRSFATVAETGGVTRAAQRLNLTQSAVSMQLKRLEAALGQPLLERDGRGVAMTAAGEQLLSYARRIVALNDEAWARMTSEEWEGALVFGAPHDIVYPHLPDVLKRFARIAPRVRVTLIASYTRALREAFARGDADLILTTEDRPDAGGETLAERDLVWIGALGGQAWRRRPTPLAFEPNCIFRPSAQAALDTAGMPWTLAVESASARGIEAAVSADLAIYAGIDGSAPPHLELVRHGGALPALPSVRINLYRGAGPRSALIEVLAGLVREAHAGEAAPRDRNAAALQQNAVSDAAV